MFKVFLSARALSDIYLKESKRTNKRNQSNWFRILLKQHTLYTIGTQIPSEEPEAGDVSEAAILWHLLKNENIELIPSDEYLGHIVDRPQTVLEQPCGVFYLDISPKEARWIQKEYGVICQSSDKPFDSKPLTAEGGTYWLSKKKEAYPWSTICESLSATPSNALCLIDRNFFVYDGQVNRRNSELQFSGIYNVLYILDNTLPMHAAEPYHVSIISELIPLEDKGNVLTSEERFSLISKKLFGLLSLLKRDYPIYVEMIAFNKKTPFFNDITHNRHIFSNYYCISAPNGLNAINYNDKMRKGTYNQKIDVQLAFSVGLRSERRDSCPIETINSVVSEYCNFINYWREDAETRNYMYASNFDGDFKTHKNRLFN